MGVGGESGGVCGARLHFRWSWLIIEGLDKQGWWMLVIVILWKLIWKILVIPCFILGVLRGSESGTTWRLFMGIQRTFMKISMLIPFKNRYIPSNKFLGIYIVDTASTRCWSRACREGCPARPTPLWFVAYHVRLRRKKDVIYCLGIKMASNVPMLNKYSNIPDICIR